MIRKFVGPAVCFSAIACAGIPTVRTDDPIVLPSGAPSTPCEQERAFEVAPTRVFVQGVTGTQDVYLYTVVTVREETVEGLGIYRTRDHELAELLEILPSLESPELERRHMARIQPYNAKMDRYSNWRLFTLLSWPGLTAAGVTGMALGNKDYELTSLGWVGLSLVVVGTVAGIVGGAGLLANFPTGQEALYGNVRNRLFLEGEDDLVEVVRSVDAFNRRVRDACSVSTAGATQTAR